MTTDKAREIFKRLKDYSCKENGPGHCHYMPKHWPRRSDENNQLNIVGDTSTGTWSARMWFNNISGGNKWTDREATKEEAAIEAIRINCTLMRVADIDRYGNPVFESTLTRKG